MYDVLISGKKAAIGIMFFSGQEIMRKVRIIITKPENADVNKADLLGLKYALLAILNKTAPVRLHLNPYAVRSLSPNITPVVNQELIAEIKEIISGFNTISINRLQDHELKEEVRKLSTVSLPAPGDALVIS